MGIGWWSLTVVFLQLRFFPHDSWESIQRCGLSVCLHSEDSIAPFIKPCPVNLSSKTKINMCFLDNASIQCQGLSNLINRQWKEYARGVNPRSAPLELSAEAGKCSPEEVTGPGCAVFAWHKTCWYFLDVKEQFVCSSEHNCCWQLLHPQPCDRRSGAGTFWGFGRLGFRELQRRGRRRWVSTRRGETVNAKSTGMNVWEPPPSMCQRYCSLSGVALHLWGMGSFPGRQ